MAFTTKATIASFGGKLLKLTHQSTTTGTPMALNLFLPPQALTTPPTRVPLLIYLSGLTCTPDNCAEKGFFQPGAARVGLAVLYPDTSPRGLDLPGERASWDFGEAAGFYLDATQPPWSGGYRMESYLTEELPAALFGDGSGSGDGGAYGAVLDRARVAITGHSMGGHGALTLYLRHPGLYRSVSAFAPIANPSECAWGRKAFAGYLGPDREGWRAHDATELVRGWTGGDLKALVDVGTGDQFYKQGQLLPENLERAAREAGVQGLTVRYQEGYDHSYYFISSFSDDHINHAAKHLGLLSE
ncbi:S-formylglutathione hydrol [Trichocladium antarcticum]|uniref:S-formylglutathione hydrolase n=1 Tax=Trichocladium antarcticum TaxID=1450529 RepID=A0AAN6USM6_9PEZI|nr:S-formylglutathione hydrol [Trichocladium antarcticum]